LTYYKPEKVHSVFDNDPTGNLYDVKLLALKDGLKLDIRIREENIVLTLGTQIVHIPKGEVNLSSIKQAFGIGSDLKVHKSDGKDWNEMLQQNTKIKNGY
jgi:hypothetical protein